MISLEIKNVYALELVVRLWNSEAATSLKSDERQDGREELANKKLQITEAAKRKVTFSIHFESCLSAML